MLTANQRHKLRELATTGHDQRMRVIALLRVKDEAQRFLQSLKRDLADANRNVERFEPGFRRLEYAHRLGKLSAEDFKIDGAPYRKAKAALDDVAAQVDQARAELARLDQKVSEQNAEAAPSAQLIGRILEHARLNRAALGIDFDEGYFGPGAPRA